MAIDPVREADAQVERAADAGRRLATFSQEKIDAVIDAIARAAQRDARHLGELAQQETGYGIARDKELKNRFSAENVYNFIRPMRTVGVISSKESVIEAASPRGVVAGIIPSTNPTSTAIFKILIAIKACDSIVLSPHPSASQCINETARLMREAGEAAGLPPGAIGCLASANLEATQALMKNKMTSVILATGGIGLVRAAYSSGKPAFGVGPGNVPAMIERSADVRKAVRDILTGKCFDNGTICSSEQAVVVERSIEPQVREAFVSEGAVFMTGDDQARLGAVVSAGPNKLNARIVGKSPAVIAAMAGLSLPNNTRAIICPIEGVGRDYPLSMEKLSPILAYYVEDELEAGCRRAAAILSYGGMGHTASIHTRDREAARHYGLAMPASRVIVNSPSTHGAIGFTTDLEPSMTLGCGSWGGNVTSDNISPRHLIDIKRIAFETRPINRSELHAPLHAGTPGREALGARLAGRSVENLIDRFLAGRAGTQEPGGGTAPLPGPPSGAAGLRGSEGQAQSPNASPAADPVRSATMINGRVYDFVCEEDVRAAINSRQKIYIQSKTIITPAARDLGEEHQIFARR